MNDGKWGGGVVRFRRYILSIADKIDFSLIKGGESLI